LSAPPAQTPRPAEPPLLTLLVITFIMPDESPSPPTRFTLLEPNPPLLTPPLKGFHTLLEPAELVCSISVVQQNHNGLSRPDTIFKIMEWGPPNKPQELFNSPARESPPLSNNNNYVFIVFDVKK